MKTCFNIILAVALATSLVEGCPFLDMKRKLQEEGHEGDDLKRMLQDVFKEFSADHPPIARDLASSCSPADADGGEPSCYGKMFPELPPSFHSWFDLLQIGLPGPDTDGTPSYMLEDFFGGDQARTMGEVSETGDVPPTFWPRSEDFTARPGVGPAGYTYIGQMFSHDVNKDKNTKLGVLVDPNDVSSSVTAAADLDTMYGLDMLVAGKFSMTEVHREGKVVGHDFPRDNITGSADIFDERNDNTAIIGQIQILFQLYHNKVFDTFMLSNACNDATGDCFNMAREETVKTWQSIIAHDVLPNLISTDVYNFMKAKGGLASYKPLFYKPGTKAYDEKRTPAEFSTCAYRVFHSRLAAAYQWDSPALFTGFASTFGKPENVDASLVGGRSIDQTLLPMPWHQLFDLRSLNNQFPSPFTGHLLDSLYVDALVKSPLGVPGNPQTIIELRCDEVACTDDCDGDKCFIVDEDVDEDIVDEFWGETASLASIDFLRGQTLQLPGGLAMNQYARRVVQGTGYPEIHKLDKKGIKGITESKFQPFGLPAAWETGEYDDIPCMLYMFIESILQSDPSGGRASRLGALGSYIVGEATFGFIRHADINIFDDLAFESMANGSYEVTMADLIDYIGATPDYN